MEFVLDIGLKIQNNIDELYDYSRSEGFGDEVKRRIMIGTYNLKSSGFYDAFYSKVIQRVRRKIAEDFKNAFKDVGFNFGSCHCDASIFKINQKKHDVISMYFGCLCCKFSRSSATVPTGFMARYVCLAALSILQAMTHFAKVKRLNETHQYLK